MAETPQANPPSAAPAADGGARGAMQVFGATMTCLAIVGYVVGIRQRTAPVLPEARASVPLAPGGVAPSYTYRELRTVRRGPNRDWVSHFDTLISRPPADADEDPRTARGRIVAERRRRRSFAGAPPTIPHPAPEGGAAACLLCHAKGRWIGDAFAPPMPHPIHARSDKYKARKDRGGVPLRSRCVSCHVQGGRPGAMRLANQFEGRASWTEPSRPKQPMKIPHTRHQIKYMRKDCLACHGFDTGPAGLRMSRVKQHEKARTSRSCTRCHTASRRYK